MISFRKMHTSKGFTLLEMAVSIGIFMVISAVVIFNHGKFNSSIVVTNLAYEVALAVRQAQVYGLAVKQDAVTPESEEYAYGVYFSNDTSAERKVFYIFADRDSDQQFDFDSLVDQCDGTLECQEKIEIRGDVEIRTLETSGEVDEITILFLRPNPVAIIRDGDGTDLEESAQIELYSSRAEKSKMIMVELSGQVSVRDN